MAVFPQRGACCTLRHCLLRGAKNGTASQRGACCTIFCSRRSTRARIRRFSTVLSVLYLTIPQTTDPRAPVSNADALGRYVFRLAFHTKLKSWSTQSALLTGCGVRGNHGGQCNALCAHQGCRTCHPKLALQRRAWRLSGARFLGLNFAHVPDQADVSPQYAKKLVKNVFTSFSTWICPRFTVQPRRHPMLCFAT